MAVDVAREIKLSEVIAALSFALDITEGQPEGHAIRTCLLGMWLADELGLPSSQRSALFYALLLKDVGCSSNAAKICSLFGVDDQVVKRDVKTTDLTNPIEGIRYVSRNVVPDGSPLERALRVLAVVRAGATRDLTEVRCDRGANIARMLEFPEETALAIRALDEHWDGRGHPDGLHGDEIPLLGRILGLAQTVEVFFTTYGPAAACDVARERSGAWFDPELVDALLTLEGDETFWRGLARHDVQAMVAALEPEKQVVRADDVCLDRIAQAFAQVIDAKSPWTYHHSEGVAEIAVGIGQVLGFSSADLRATRRAALLHDIGKLGISNRILDKPAGLADEERREIGRHPEYTLRILERVAAFRDVAELAASHHECLDGRGYHRGLTAAGLPMAARVVEVADICQALSVDRPYRPALPREEVYAIMRRDLGTGICPTAVEALRAFLEQAEPRPLRLAS